MLLATWYILLLGLASSALALQQMPRFTYKESRKVLLTWSDTWQVGASNMLAILTKDKIINIQIAVAGDLGGGLKRILIYECPNDAGRSEEIDLTTLTTSSFEMRCPSDIPFTIQAASADAANDKFELKMVASKIPYADVFKKKVKISVRVEFPTGVLMSNPLLVWNLDPLSSFSTASPVGPMNTRFLTDNAIYFMTNSTYYTSRGEFSYTSFLQSAFKDVFDDAPTFFKSKLNIGSILYFDAGSCLNYQLGKAMLFTSYYSKLDERHHNLLKLMHLDVHNGLFSYSSCGMRQEMKQFFDQKRPSSTIGICTMVSFSGESEPYLKIEAVDQRYPLSGVHYTGCTEASRNCKVVLNAQSKVTIVSGMDSTAIVCPIVCSDSSVVYRFFKNGKRLIGSSSQEWSDVDGVKVSKSGNIVDFPSTVSSAQSGTYRCEAGSEVFSFDVNVISLPHFCSATSMSERHDTGLEGELGLLPERVFAMEGESLEYSCTATLASLSSVTVTPAFYIATTTSGKLSWGILTAEPFRIKTNATEKSFSLTTAQTNASKSLTVSVSPVPPANPSLGANFSHRFECKASVGSVESQLMGMSKYQVQTGADVKFISRPNSESFVINPSNNCSVQKCSVQNGASFEFALTADTVAYLHAIGVEIVAYFRIDNLLLNDVTALFGSGASKVTFNASSSQLAYKIEPITDQGVLDELLRRRSLTAVYNLRYKSAAAMRNLRLNKSAHGKASPALGKMDCRADPLCFYSTDYDLAAGGRLDFLGVELTFELAPLPSKAGMHGILIGAGIAAIVAIVLGLIVAFMVTRPPEEAYSVEKMEIQLGHNPRAEAKDEQFKEYMRVGSDQDDVEPPVAGVKRSLTSVVSVNSKDDLELS